MTIEARDFADVDAHGVTVLELCAYRNSGMCDLDYEKVVPRDCENCRLREAPDE